MQCPKCGEKIQFLTERSHDGMTQCLRCRYNAPHREFHVVEPPAELALEPGRTYTESEARKLVAAAFRESASIVHGAFSFPVAHMRMSSRAKEIEAGAPFPPPPRGKA